MDYGSNKDPKFLPDFNIANLIDRWGEFNFAILYMGYFGAVASQHSYGNLDLKKFHKAFPLKYGKSINGYYFNKNNLRKDWKSDFTYILEKQIIVHKSNEEVILFFQREDCELLKDIISFTKNLKKSNKNKSHINLIINRHHGLENKKIRFKKFDLNLSKIYNDDFQSFHEKILRTLKENNKSGLHLLYGKPGTGKSTYIRYLCGLLKKEIVFLPGQMAQNLDNIAMTKYLIDHPNSILVIEDAEELIVSRDSQRNSNLAMILNITDGILGESLGIQIIATFNTDVKNI